MTTVVKIKDLYIYIICNKTQINSKHLFIAVFFVDKIKIIEMRHHFADVLRNIIRGIKLLKKMRKVFQIVSIKSVKTYSNLKYTLPKLFTNWNKKKIISMAINS